MIIRSKNIIAIPPGATIKEQLVDREMSQKEFASRMGMSEKHISKLINGDVALTDDVAIRLEMVLGLPARFWTNLESIYRENITHMNLERAETETPRCYQKKPIIITAIQWTGNNFKEVKDFADDNVKLENNELVITTLEDGNINRIKHVASVDDYIIKGINGEFYPCKPDIFDKTYDEL